MWLITATDGVHVDTKLYDMNLSEALINLKQATPQCQIYVCTYFDAEDAGGNDTRPELEAAGWEIEDSGHDF